MTELTGIEIWEIGRILTIGSKAEIRELRTQKNSPVPGHTSMDRHYKRVFKIVPSEYKHLIPNGIAAARELSKFGDKLIPAFKDRLIASNMIRFQVDQLYIDLGGNPPAPRNP